MNHFIEKYKKEKVDSHEIPIDKLILKPTKLYINTSYSNNSYL